MTLAQFTIHANRILSLHRTLEISDEEMYNIFEKPERKTQLGNAAANFCGLPTETKTLAQWLKANGLVATKPKAQHAMAFGAKLISNTLKNADGNGRQQWPLELVAKCTCAMERCLWAAS